MDLYGFAELTPECRPVQETEKQTAPGSWCCTGSR